MDSPLVCRSTQEQLYVKLGLNLGNRVPIRSHAPSPTLCLTSVTSAPAGDSAIAPTTGLCVSYTDRKNKFAINIRDVRNLAGTTRLSVTSQRDYQCGAGGRSSLAVTSAPSASMQQRLEQVANGESARMSNLVNVSGGKKEVIYFTNGSGSIISLRRILSKGYGEKAAVEAGGLMRGEMVQTNDGSILVMIRRQDAIDTFGHDAITALPQAATEPLAIEGASDRVSPPDVKCHNIVNVNGEVTTDSVGSVPQIPVPDPEPAMPSPPAQTTPVTKKRKHCRSVKQPAITAAAAETGEVDVQIRAPPKRKKAAPVSVEDTAAVLVGLEQMLAEASGGMNEMLGIQMTSDMGFGPIDVDDLTARYMTNSPESVIEDNIYDPNALPHL